MSLHEEPIRWATSSRSESDDGHVEVAMLPDGSVKVRDSSAGEAGPVLTFTPSEWRAFVAGVHDGEFDRLD